MAVIRRLNYQHLLYFWSVVRTGSLTRACEELALSAPTVSSQLRTLEERLGEKLLDRSRVVVRRENPVEHRPEPDHPAAGMAAGDGEADQPIRAGIRTCPAFVHDRDMGSRPLKLS